MECLKQKKLNIYQGLGNLKIMWPWHNAYKISHSAEISYFHIHSADLSNIYIVAQIFF